MENILRIRPGELPDIIKRLSDEAAGRALLGLSPAEATAVIGRLDPAKAARALSHLPLEATIHRLERLAPNQIADIVPHLPEALRAGLLGGLPADLSQAIATLLRYRPDTAGGTMDNRFIAVRADDTVSQALERLRPAARLRQPEVVYIYVTDENQRLMGVISLRDLVFSAPSAKIGEIMNREVVFLQINDDQEEIARRIHDQPFLGLPVVDEDGRLAGIVRVPEALRVAEREATKDMQLMVGLSGEERLWTPWPLSIRRRLPWLGVNLATALVAATVVSFFEETISRWTALVAFLPLICAVAGNAGNQALTVLIRSFALGDVADGDARRALRKEFLIGVANGLALSLAIGLLAFAWKGSALLALVAGASMLANQVIGAVAGVAIPFGLKWCKIDPALASSIFVTALTDTMGFLVFLGTATLALKVVGF